MEEEEEQQQQQEEEEAPGPLRGDSCGFTGAATSGTAGPCRDGRHCTAGCADDAGPPRDCESQVAAVDLHRL